MIVALFFYYARSSTVCLDGILKADWGHLFVALAGSYAQTCEIDPLIGSKI